MSISVHSSIIILKSSMYHIPSFIHIYGKGVIENPNLEKVSAYLKSLLLDSVIDLRTDFVSYYFTSLDPAKKDKEIDSLAKKLAEIRVLNPTKQNLNPDPLYAEIEYEKKKILNPSTKSIGVFYDGFELQNIYRDLLIPPHPPLEKGGRGDFPFAHAHIIFTNQLFATWEGDDRRYHTRASIYGFPSIISTSGIVEAPAKPREFYLLKQQYGVIGRDDLALSEFKRKFKGIFIDYNEPRLTDVSKGYTAQALFFHITGEPFCDDKGCRLFNAHWQEELIYSQLESPYEFCEKHAGILEIVRGKS
ncbi:MAG: DUF6775 family putative metallopeptidase [Nitrospinota bacterium]|mgnify:FL=1